MYKWIAMPRVRTAFRLRAFGKEQRWGGPLGGIGGHISLERLAGHDLALAVDQPSLVIEVEPLHLFVPQLLDTWRAGRVHGFLVGQVTPPRLAVLPFL